MPIVATVECTQCGGVMYPEDVEWLGEVPYCERCYRQAKIDEEVNAQEANNEAEREVSGRPWGR